MASTIRAGRMILLVAASMPRTLRERAQPVTLTFALA
jgi:hypothetical protein